MSDMIDGLSRTALEAGQEASHNLTESSALAAMAQRVQTGRRKRRLQAAAVAGGSVAALVAGAFVVPQLLDEPPVLDPAVTISPARTVVSSVGNLTVFSDGSMSLYTQRGTFVDFPPAVGPEHQFSVISHVDACSFDPEAATLGWDFHVDEGREVLLFARPGVQIGMSKRQVTGQGERLGTFDHRSLPYPTFTFDAEVATGPQLAIRETVYDVFLGEDVAPTPVVKSYASAIEASPSVTIAGDADSFTRVATVESKPLGSGLACLPGFAEEILERGEPYTVRRYLVADIFLLDREGHSMLLASHTSWTELEIQP